MLFHLDPTHFTQNIMPVGIKECQQDQVITSQPEEPPFCLSCLFFKKIGSIQPEEVFCWAQKLVQYFFSVRLVWTKCIIQILVSLSDLLPIEVVNWHLVVCCWQRVLFFKKSLHIETQPVREKGSNLASTWFAALRSSFIWANFQSPTVWNGACQTVSAHLRKNQVNCRKTGHSKWKPAVQNAPHPQIGSLKSRDDPKTVYSHLLSSVGSFCSLQHGAKILASSPKGTSTFPPLTWVRDMPGPNVVPCEGKTWDPFLMEENNHVAKKQKRVIPCISFATQYNVYWY